jgi:hypothetical protein
MWTREDQREYYRRWREANLEHCRQQGREYAKIHKEERNERSRRWQEEHPDRVREHRRKWRKKNRMRSKEYMDKYRKDHKKRIGDLAKKSLQLRKDRNTKIANESKRGGCTYCGYNKDPVALDHHHKKGTKKIKSVAYMVCNGWNEKVLRAEIAKCFVICACCHRILTHRKPENQ